MRYPLKAAQNNTWAAENPLTLDESTRDNLNRLKVSVHQNIYEADFEYGVQSLRWEAFLNGSATITHLPILGGVRLSLTAAVGDVAIRQSRPYHRYQPGKTMFMASAVQFGAAVTGQVQRVGFFDDGNGVFFEQGDPTTLNPSGMGVVVRTDASGTVTNNRVTSENWACSDSVRGSLDWTRIQMVWIEYAWYGAGALRWGVFIEGEPIVLHKIAYGNRAGQTTPWARTGNLPVRYEQRNVTASTAADMTHWGVSVMVEGRIDDQRGFTYSYGMAAATPLRTVTAGTRFPVLSVRARQMGTVSESNTATGGSTTTLTRTGAGWTVNQWAGYYLYTTGGTGSGQVARILSNTATTLTFEHNILPGVALSTALAASTTYQIGLVNRGQLLPRQLFVQSSAVCIVELIVSTPSSPVTLTSPTFTTLVSLGSANSFAERDVVATGTVSGGEVVFGFVSPNNQLQTIDLSNLFPLFNTIRGGATDILTVAVTGTANVGASIVCQEAMS
jgi:hypothetical protein